MRNYYQSGPENSVHLSIGAIPVNDKGEIGCHYYKQRKEKTDLYRLVTETVEPGERLEETVARGLREELGIAVGSLRFAGSRIYTLNYKIFPHPIQKTVVCFVCKYLHADPQGREVMLPGQDPSDVVWVKADILKQKFKEQGERYDWEWDQSDVIEQVEKFLD